MLPKGNETLETEHMLSAKVGTKPSDGARRTHRMNCARRCLSDGLDNHMRESAARVGVNHYLAAALQ